jgi:hypothetical protein
LEHVTLIMYPLVGCSRDPRGLVGLWMKFRIIAVVGICGAEGVGIAVCALFHARRSGADQTSCDVLQVFYDSFDQDFAGRWVVSQSSDYGGIYLGVFFVHLRLCGMIFIY